MEEIDGYDLYLRFESRVNTSQNGFFRPQTDFERAVNDINMEMFIYKTDEAEKTQQNQDDLLPFLHSVNIITKKNGSEAFAIYPKEYSRFSSARVLLAGSKCYPQREICDGKCIGPDNDALAEQEIIDEFYDNVKTYPIDLIEDSRWGSVTIHKTKGPKLTSPKMTQRSKGFIVLPRDVSVVILDYYIQPRRFKFAYTKAPGNPQTGAGDQIIYDKDNSIQLQWSPTLINEFLDRLEKKYIQFTQNALAANIERAQSGKPLQRTR